MKPGKKICETLKAIRRDIAVANEIDYTPAECHHEGDCAGTCPKCESETRWLERQLRVRQALGKAVTIAGLSLALGTLTSCHDKPGKHASDDSESSSISCSREASGCDDDVAGNLDESTISFTFPAHEKLDTSLFSEDDDDEDDREVVMGEVAIDENGNTYGP